MSRRVVEARLKVNQRPEEYIYIYDFTIAGKTIKRI